MRRIVAIGVGLGAIVATAGATWVVASQVMRSPAELAAEADAPQPSQVTVPVERTELVADVIVRGTVEFAEPLVVSLTGSVDVEGDLIVTHAPEEGTVVDEGDVIVQVSGRPVIALGGEVPAFRDLRPGRSGEDVEQLQEALDRLGYDVGDVDGHYGPATEDAVAQLYQDAGFAPPSPSEEERDRLEQAEERLSTASEQLAQARQQRDQAAEGPSRSELLQAESAVNEARAALDDLPDEASDAEVEQAELQLQIAVAARDELLQEPDTSAEERAVAAATEERDRAQQQLDRLNEGIGTWLPAGEIVFVQDLPQRVDSVETARGRPADGELVTLSSAEVALTVEVPQEDVELVDVGDRALLRPDEGEEIDGELVEIADSPGTGDAAEDSHAARVVPLEDAEELVGASVRVRIPVSSTDGEVLAVPIVAVYAAADGSSQVEVIDDGAEAGADDGDGRNSRMVTVEPGLSTDGLVEVTPLDGELEEGDQVVVGAP